MQIRYYKEYSRYLNRDMEFKVYGHAGRPILIFPCQSGRFFDWEDRNMCNLAAPWIDAGKLQIIAADSIDRESWDNDGPARPRIEMQERWYNYVCEELPPVRWKSIGSRGRTTWAKFLWVVPAWVPGMPSTYFCAVPTCITAPLP